MRILVDRENAVVDELRAKMAKPDRRPAYSTATRDFVVDGWDGEMPILRGMGQVAVARGQTLKIPRMMRHGYLGVTADLDGDGTVQAVMPHRDDRIADLRWTREPTGFDPQDDADRRFDEMVGGKEDIFQ